MTFTQSCRAITKAYDILHKDIESITDLNRHHLTLSDYHAACEIMEEIRKPNTSTQTFIKSVADFFEKCGYTVTAGTVNYTISC